MIRWINANFWVLISRLILRNRVILLLIVAGITVFMSMQWKHMQFSFTEANLLPDDHEYNLQYEEFLSIFGEEAYFTHFLKRHSRCGDISHATVFKLQSCVSNVKRFTDYSYAACCYARDLRFHHT